MYNPLKALHLFFNIQDINLAICCIEYNYFAKYQKVEMYIFTTK